MKTKKGEIRISRYYLKGFIYLRESKDLLYQTRRTIDCKQGRRRQESCKLELCQRRDKKQDRSIFIRKNRAKTDGLAGNNRSINNMRIFSGIRPTGDLHIGNYIGAIKQWIELQDNNESVFCIVDLHAITTPYDPKKLQKNVLSQATSYLSLGLNPEKCILFVQSDVKEHTELTWLLGTITPMEISTDDNYGKSKA